VLGLGRRFGGGRGLGAHRRRGLDGAALLALRHVDDDRAPGFGHVIARERVDAAEVAVAEVELLADLDQVVALAHAVAATHQAALAQHALDVLARAPDHALDLLGLEQVDARRLGVEAARHDDLQDLPRLQPRLRVEVVPRDDAVPRDPEGLAEPARAGRAGDLEEHQARVRVRRHQRHRGARTRARRGLGLAAGGRDQQDGVALELGGVVELVEAAQRGLGGAMALGDLREGLAVADAVLAALAAAAVPAEPAGALLKQRELVLRDPQRGALAGRGALADQVGVELLEHRQVLTERPGHAAQRGRGRGLHARQVDRRQAARKVRPDVEGRAVATDDRGGDDLRHVHRRRVRQAALLLAQRPEVVGVAARHAGHHQAVAGVEGGERHLPRAEADAQVLEVGGGGVRGPLDVVALVDPVVALEPVDPPGALHELPHAGGADPRSHSGVEAALGHRHEHEVLGHADLLQDRAQDVLVAVHAADPALDQGLTARVVAEVLEVRDRLLVPAHRQVGQCQRGHPRLGRRGDDRRAGTDREVLALEVRQVLAWARLGVVSPRRVGLVDRRAVGASAANRVAAAARDHQRPDPLAHVLACADRTDRRQQPQAHEGEEKMFAASAQGGGHSWRR
jgi:hypothetical protein